MPFGAVGLEHWPVEESQEPATWHASEAAQVTGFAPAQAPDWQVSVRVQALPSLQAVPLGAAGLEHRPVEELQVPAAWHWSCGAQTTGLLPTQLPSWHASV